MTAALKAVPLERLSLGTVRLKREGRDAQWVIEAQPHVLLRLKRTFASTSRSVGKLTLSDTDANARELLWFMDRFALDVPSAADQKHMAARAAAHREREDAVARLIAGHHASVGTWELALPPRDYQMKAAELALATHGLLLADDVGLGKTAAAICTFTDPRTLPAVVVTLTHLPRQWQRELAKFAPRLRVHIVKKGTPYDLRPKSRKRKVKVADAQDALFAASDLEPSLPDVIIINYAKLGGWADVLAPLAKSVVFDEVQELRIAKTVRDGKKVPSLKYAAAKQIALGVDFRLGLSATPIYNYGGEMWSVLDVLRPGDLGTLEEFMTEWGTSERMIKDPRAFGTYARAAGLMLRRTRAEVGRELPPVTRAPQYVDADLDALDAVHEAVAELARVILGQGPQTVKGERMLAAEEFSWKLRQATGIAKAAYVAEFVRLLVEAGEKVALFGWHREVYGIWQKRLEDLHPVFYTGSESPTQKDEARRRFIEDPDCKVMIISHRSGAGLDGLQSVCRTVVFGELDWSPGVHEQNIGRIARDGQTDPVIAYFLLSEHGTDPVMGDVLEVKEQQALGVRDPDAALVEHLQVDPDRIKKLAIDYLTRKGIALPAPPAAEAGAPA